ncbi:MAG: hypothetical protein NTZ05_21305 [Chloroflexi bacterium]|nr:hypothetical protein [Chloroflexota bacterium]
MQIDQQVYRQSFGTTVVLNQEEARLVAAEYLADLGAGFAANVATEPQRVVGAVSKEVSSSFLRIVGVNTVRISAVSPADLRFGIAGSGT